MSLEISCRLAAHGAAFPVIYHLNDLERFSSLKSRLARAPGNLDSLGLKRAYYHFHGIFNDHDAALGMLCTPLIH